MSEKQSKVSSKTLKEQIEALLEEYPPKTLTGKIANFVMHHYLDLESGYATTEKALNAIRFLEQLLQEKTSLVAHLKMLNDKGCWVGEHDSRKDAFNYVIELLVAKEEKKETE